MSDKEHEKISDVEYLREYALKLGATKSAIIDADSVVLDRRVQLKCRYPPCINYGKNLMCPPFTLTNEEFGKILKSYKHGILFQMEDKIPDNIKALIKNDITKLSEFYKDDDYKKAQLENSKARHEKVNKIIANIESEAFKRGWLFPFGLGIGSCKLCDTCDVKSPCKRPYEARPSMEGMGINVNDTVKNVGWQIEWNTKEIIYTTALVLL